jgi:hypothetical protein
MAGTLLMTSIPRKTAKEDKTDVPEIEGGEEA